MSNPESLSLIEDIITCANVSASSNGNGDNLYIRAYKELAIYLKHLFIYYDNKIIDDELKPLIDKFGWIKLFTKLNQSTIYDEIFIVTYNYDIWLERILRLAGINFMIGVLEQPQIIPKFSIVKPHGSISFAHKLVLDKESFDIGYKKTLRDLLEGDPEDFSVKYTDLDHNYLINSIIPPAGDSERLEFGWAKTLRQYAKGKASELTATDEIIICGISYWNVDRNEIDEILTSLTKDINLKLVNPNPPRALNAVISSLFDNYLCYTSSDLLGV